MYTSNSSDCKSKTFVWCSTCCTLHWHKCKVVCTVRLWCTVHAHTDRACVHLHYVYIFITVDVTLHNHKNYIQHVPLTSAISSKTKPACGHCATPSTSPAISMHSSNEASSCTDNAYSSGKWTNTFCTSCINVCALKETSHYLPPGVQTSCLMQCHMCTQ